MNEQLQSYARQQLKEGLSGLPEKWQLVFKRMYSHDNLELDIDSVVEGIPADKLDWAMQQVDASIQKLGARKENQK